MVAGATAASAASMDGMYKRPNGHMVKVSACGNSFCVTSQTAPNVGRSVGKLTPSGDGKFTGSLTDLSNGKTYSGKARFDGSTLKVSGCVLGGLICKTENWARQ